MGAALMNEEAIMRESNVLKSCIAFVDGVDPGRATDRSFKFSLFHSVLVV